jgi:hypothetical protein
MVRALRPTVTSGLSSPWENMAPGGSLSPGLPCSGGEPLALSQSVSQSVVTLVTVSPMLLRYLPSFRGPHHCEVALPMTRVTFPSSSLTTTVM